MLLPLSSLLLSLYLAHRVIKDDDVVIKVLDDCLEWYLFFLLLFFLLLFNFIITTIKGLKSKYYSKLMVLIQPLIVVVIAYDERVSVSRHLHSKEIRSTMRQLG